MGVREKIQKILREESYIPPSAKRRLHYVDEYINNLDPNDVCNHWVIDEVDEYVSGSLSDIIRAIIGDSSGIDSDNYGSVYDVIYEFLVNSNYTEQIRDFFFDSMDNCGNVLKEETKIQPVLRNLLNMLFEGFDDIYYNWANYMCGMGECCDPYAIGFTLPEKDYDDYIFKLVDGEMYDDDADYPKEFRDELPEPCYQQPDLKDPRFDTIVFYGLYAEDIENYFGSEDNWALDLLKIINNQFGCDAKRIIII